MPPAPKDVNAFVWRLTQMITNKTFTVTLRDGLGPQFVVHVEGLLRHKITIYPFRGGINESINRTAKVAEVSHTEHPTMQLPRPNLDLWSSTMDFSSGLDPAVLIFATAYDTIRRRRTMPFTDSLRALWKSIWAKPAK